MKISEAINTLKAERSFNRTPSGRPLTNYAVDILESALQDIKNHGMEVMQCINCKFIGSSLLFSDGCGNCGSKDLTTDINKMDII